MERLGCSLTQDLIISRIRTNLDVLRPSDLTVVAKVNSAKERFVRQRYEHAATDVSGEVDDTVCTIRISNLKSISTERLYASRSDHCKKMPEVPWSASFRGQRIIGNQRALRELKIP